MDRTRNPVARGIVCAATVLCCAHVLRAVEFAGGTGRTENPYQIATAEQLILIGSPGTHFAYLPKMHYVLVASVDLSGTVWSSPVIPQFSGSLDGNGHTIRGLKARGLGAQGLFGEILKEGQVMNLQLEDVSLVGMDKVGGLATANAGTVSNCHVVGRIVGTGSDVGGLVAVNTGTITGSSSAADVSGGDRVGGLAGRNEGGALLNCRSTAIVFGPLYFGGPNGRDVGGLVGVNAGTITGAFSAADVSGGDRVGGLAGYNQRGALLHCAGAALVLGRRYVGGLVGSNGGSITASYSDSDVTGVDELGGLVGSNAGDVSECYSTGFVTGQTDTGGLIGRNEGMVLSCYSAVIVTGQGKPVATSVGGLVGGGHYVSSSDVKRCYFLSPADGGGPDNKIGMPLTAAQMMQPSSFPGWDLWGTALDGDDDSWFVPADALPVLTWQMDVTGLQMVPDVAWLSLDKAREALTAAGFVPGTLSYDVHRALDADHVICAYPRWAAGGETIDLVLSSGRTYDWTDNPGDGTAANPYQIETAGQLESLVDHAEFRDKHFVLTADLEMGGRTYPTALIGWNKADPRPPAQPIAFDGTFDGRGHTIRNLSIVSDGSSRSLGLFGVVGQSGRVSDLHLLNTHVTAGATREESAGFLAASNYGTLIDCSAAGGLVGRTLWEGLVDYNQGSVTNCFVDGILVADPPWWRH